MIRACGREDERVLQRNAPSFGKLQAMVRHGYQRVPYYVSVLRELPIDPLGSDLEHDFQSLPIVDKDTVLTQTDRFISLDHEKEELVYDRTSGSTGKILGIYWDRRDLMRSLMSLWSKRKILHGIVPISKCCSFHSINYRTDESDGSSGERAVFSPRIMLRDKGRVLSLSKLDFSDRMLRVYYNRMCEFGPEWIMCHPTTILLFSRFLAREGLPSIPSVRYIELTGEFMDETQRERIREVFDVAIVNHYGAREVNGIAFECRCGRLHCLANNVFVEIIKDDHKVGYEQEGEVCITGLNNHAMPLIRYNLGDRGMLVAGDSCPCGDGNPILKISAGRGNALVKGQEDGEEVECVVFFYVVESLNAEYDNVIVQFQVVRKAADWFEVRLVLDRQKEHPNSRLLKDVFVRRLQDHGFSSSTQWMFLFCEEILPDHASGKLNFYIDETCLAS